MLHISLSRAVLATLAGATLVSVTSGAAYASPKIDPGFSRGAPRIDPGFGNGSKVDPGFNKNSGPKFTVKQVGHYELRANCYWIDRPGTPQPKHPGPGMGQNSGKVKVCY